MGVGCTRQVELLRDKAVKELRGYCRTTGDADDSDTRFSRCRFHQSNITAKKSFLKQIF
jgi:hypothetical protein